VRAVVAAPAVAQARVAPADPQAAFQAAVRAAALDLRQMSSPATTPAAPPLAG
jgi:hypothetical protein